MITPPLKTTTSLWCLQTSLKCPVILPWNLLWDVKTSGMEDNWVLLLSRALSNVPQRFYETRESLSNPYCIYSWKLGLDVTERPQLHRDGPTRVNLISPTSKQWRQLTAREVRGKEGESWKLCDCRKVYKEFAYPVMRMLEWTPDLLLSRQN